jgi:hypothetical protein
MVLLPLRRPYVVGDPMLSPVIPGPQLPLVPAGGTLDGGGMIVTEGGLVSIGCGRAIVDAGVVRCTTIAII